MKILTTYHLERSDEMTQDTVYMHYYKSIGYCPRCRGKNKLMGDEKNCPECRAKSYAQYLKRDKEKAREYLREWNKRKYHERKEQGICVRCGKRKAQHGIVRCALCNAKDTDTRHTREARKAD